MILRKKIILFSIALVLMGFLGFTAHAQTNTAVVNVVWGGSGMQSQVQNILGLGDNDPRITVAKIIRVLLGFLGILAICLILYAGFVWMMSGGNEEKISKAKAILKNAVIGLIIILASFGIVSFLIIRLLGSTFGGGGGGSGGGGGGGISGLGNGIVQYVYPEPFQKNVPRNTTILVTFREAMKAATICQDVTISGDCAPGSLIKSDSIRIFRTGDTTLVTDVLATSTDNKTFIFKPNSLLGDQNGDIDYTVNLTTDIKKADGSSAFSLSTGFIWTFEVSNDVDLESPKILNYNQGGIFPLPDDDQDTVTGTTTPTPAQGQVTVASLPLIYQAPTATITRVAPPSITTTNATISGTNRCDAGTVTISIIDVSGTLKARVSYTQSGLSAADLNIISNRFDIAPCRLTVNLDPGFVAGHGWRIAVTPEVIADTLTVGSKIYTFVSTSPDDNQILRGASPAITAGNIRDAVNAIHPEVTARLIGINGVMFRAKIAGSAGNRLELSTSNPIALTTSPFSGGTDLTTIYNVQDLPDQPKNTVIQINFNESMNPLTLSGTSVEVADKLRVVNADSAAKTDGQTCVDNKECRSYKCNSGLCQGNELAGKFVVSNQYKTTEFISDIKCGVNGCGESIYCLPANSHLRVEVEAASLQACSTNTDCTVSPYNTCVSGTCQDSQNKNYPVASSLNGLTDLANNSFDGNRNNNAQGKVDVWNENLDSTTNGDRGDNYQWSFWVSDRLDLTSPTIVSTSINNNQSSVGLTTPVEVLFSKLMLGSSLTSGSIIVNNGLTTVNHHLINFWSRANDAIGYWIEKVDKDLNPVDGRADQTSAIINHGFLNDSTDYRAQVGSGVKDIYQNCYKPSSGPTCTANPLNPSCCRNTSGDLDPTNLLNSQGNCIL